MRARLADLNQSLSRQSGRRLPEAAAPAFDLLRRGLVGIGPQLQPIFILPVVLAIRIVPDRDGSGLDVGSIRQNRRLGEAMYALIGRVKIKPGHEEETRAMVAEHGVPMVRDMAGSAGAYWTRGLDDDELIQHSFWLFENEETARQAEATFTRLREMPDAPATFVSAEVCEVIGET